MPNFAGLTGSQMQGMPGSLTSSVDKVGNKLQSAVSSTLGKGLMVAGALGAVAKAFKGAEEAKPTEFKDIRTVATSAMDTRAKTAAPKRADAFQGVTTIPRDLSPHHYMRLTIMRYDRAHQLDPAKTLPVKVIGLPIPTNLSEQFGAAWNEVALGAMVGVAEAAAYNAAQGNAEQAGANLANLLSSENLMTAVKGGVRGVVRSVPGVGAFAEAAGNAASLNLGVVRNPHLSLVFSQMALRRHTFTFRLFPYDQGELQDIKEVVKLMKLATLPSLTRGGDGGEAAASFGFTFPYQLDVAIMSGGNKDPIFKIKTCIIRSLNINYSPSGTPAFFADGSPAEVELSFELEETSVHTREDYEGSEELDKFLDPDRLSRQKDVVLKDNSEGGE